jgi:hypothetical protein
MPYQSSADSPMKKVKIMLENLLGGVSSSASRTGPVTTITFRSIKHWRIFTSQFRCTRRHRHEGDDAAEARAIAVFRAVLKPLLVSKT